MEHIKVVVYGAAGRMGQEVINAVCKEPDMQVVGAVDLKVSGESLSLPDGSGEVPFSADFAAILDKCRPDVVVDFTVARATMPAVRIAAEKGVNMVIGATGLTPDDLDEMRKLADSSKIGIMMAPNFALGAVLMIHLARLAGKYMNHAEIIELHHDRKLDAPSGTSQTTARAMAETRGRPFLPPAVVGEASESRGKVIEGIQIHSVRLPGFMAHQEVILGGDGQTLRIRHDQISREGFMPGVMLAIKEIGEKPGFTYGLDALLGL